MASSSYTTETKFFQTTDNIRLHYLQIENRTNDSNNGTIILIPGWSQTAAMFCKQFEALSEHYKLICLDPRGHGQSDKPPSGYRIGRLAKDVYEVLQMVSSYTSEYKKPIHLLAHSAGCPVVWELSEMFGTNLFQSAIFVDQPISFTKRPNWSEEECKQYGAVGTAEQVKEIQRNLAKDEDGSFSREFVAGMFSSDFDELDWVMSENLQFPRVQAALMVGNVMGGDYRDLLPTISVPSLCVGGMDSSIPGECMEYMSQLLPDAELAILPGSHFLFYEQPDTFNATVLQFLSKQNVNTL